MQYKISDKCKSFILDCISELKYLYPQQIDSFVAYTLKYYPGEDAGELSEFIQNNVGND